MHRVFTPEAELLPSRWSTTRTSSRHRSALWPGSAHRGLEELHAGARGCMVADDHLDSKRSHFSGAVCQEKSNPKCGATSTIYVGS